MGRNLFRLGFDPRRAENSDEHVLGSSMHAHASCACSGHPCAYSVHAYTCLFIKHVHIGFHHAHTYSLVYAHMLGHVGAVLCPKDVVTLFFHLIFSQYDPYPLVFDIFKGCCHTWVGVTLKPYLNGIGH